MNAPESTRPVTVAVLIEWRAPSLGEDDARRLAEETAAAFRRVPGLVDIRFFGSFDTGTHWYLQTWESREAHEAYLSSEEMFSIRDLAAPYVEGRPTRQVLVDYTPARRA